MFRVAIDTDASEHASPSFDHPVWVQLSDVSYFGPSIVSEGNPFTLHCRLSIFEAARWTLNGRVIVPRSGYVIEERTEKKLIRIVTLSVAKASIEDTGDYRCNSWSRLYHRLDVVALANSVHSDESRENERRYLPGIVLDLDNSITLPCNQSARGIVRWCVQTIVC